MLCLHKQFPNTKIDSLVVNVGKSLKNKNLSLVTAESCTGGALAYLFSKHPECSSILERGYVTYSNPSKESILEVNPSTLQIQGAVSKHTVIEMANGALKNSLAQVSIAITGIAGPDKIQKEKSKNTNGLVWICCVDVFGYKIIKKKHIRGGRSNFIQNVVFEALLMLNEYIKSLK